MCGLCRGSFLNVLQRYGPLVNIRFTRADFYVKVSLKSKGAEPPTRPAGKGLKEGASRKQFVKIFQKDLQV
jgi:hypothetical protein